MTSLGLHLIKFPTGRYGWRGSIPESLLDWKPPTRSDIMGGRVQFSGPNKDKAHYDRVYASVSEALTDASRVGADVCNSAGCACRDLFSANTKDSEVNE